MTVRRGRIVSQSVNRRYQGIGVSNSAPMTHQNFRAVELEVDLVCDSHGDAYG